VIDYNSLSSYLSRFITGDVIGAFAFWSLLVFVFRKQLSKWLKLPNFKAIVVGITFAAIFATTLRIWGSNGFDPIPWFLNLDRWNHSFDIGVNWLLNVALFIPAGAMLTYYGKRTTIALASLVVTSAGIELIQQYTKWGVSDAADFVANTAGAAIGVAIGLTLKRALK